MATSKTANATPAAPAAPVRKAAAKKATPKKAAPKKATAKPVAAKDVAAKPAPVPTAVPVPTPSKVKHKLVRDSFTIPKAEYLVLQGLKERAADLKRPTKKSELLRAGIAALQAMPEKAFLAALAAVPALKTGRPKGDDAPAKDPAGK